MKSKLIMKYQSDILRKQQLEGCGLDGASKDDLLKLKKTLLSSLEAVNSALSKA